MRGLGTVVSTIFKALTALGIPKWGIALLVGALVAWIGPKVVEELERDKGRRIVMASRLDSKADQAEADARALDAAGRDPRALALVAEAAVETGRQALADESLARLSQLGAAEPLIAKLEARRHGRLPLLAVEAVMKLERMLVRGEYDEARVLARRATRRWPHDVELRALRALAEAGPPPELS